MENIRMAYNKKKVDFLNKTISLKKGVIVSASRNYFGDYVTVYSNTNILGSYIDTGTYISTNCYLPNLKIGKYCSIASEVRVIIGNHPTSKFVSTHPAFFSTRKQAGFSYVDEEKYQDEIKYSTKGYLCEIGNDVWIGYGVKILSGVTIGDGAIIGAGSIVTRNIEPYTINVGIPSRIVKKRFSDEHIDFLLKFEWWNKDEKWLNNNAKYFLNIDEFIQKWSIYDI